MIKLEEESEETVREVKFWEPSQFGAWQAVAGWAVVTNPEF